MCLDEITEVYKLSLFNLWIPKFAYKSGMGWKFFSVGVKKNLFSYWQGNATKMLPINKWLCEKNHRGLLYRDDEFISGYYPFGWHILEESPEIPDSRRVASRRVEYKEGHTLGIDAKYKALTIVAKYMKILP